MTTERLNYLRQESNAERLDLVEIAEIEEAFSKIPNAQLRDRRENATVTDMLDEIETRSNNYLFRALIVTPDNGEVEISVSDANFYVGLGFIRLAKVIKNPTLSEHRYRLRRGHTLKSLLARL